MAKESWIEKLKRRSHEMLKGEKAYISEERHGEMKKSRAVKKELAKWEKRGRPSGKRAEPAKKKEKPKKQSKSDIHALTGYQRLKQAGLSDAEIKKRLGK